MLLLGWAFEHMEENVELKDLLEPAIVESLQVVKGLTPEMLTPETLAAIRTFVISGAATLQGLEHLSVLERLVLRSCEVDDVTKVPQLPQLVDLAMWFLPVRSIAPLTVCTKLKKVELQCCMVEDLSPLLELPELWRMTSWGLPLTETSYFEVLPALRELFKQRDYGRECDAFMCDREPVWRLCRELYERGLRAVYYEGDWGVPRVAFPGLKYTSQPELERFDCDEPVLRAILDENPQLDTQQLFDILTEMPWAQRAPSQTNRG